MVYRRQSLTLALMQWELRRVFQLSEFYDVSDPSDRQL